MLKDVVTRLLEGNASKTDREALRERLRSDADSAAPQLNDAWVAPPSPDVFPAAFAEAFPRAPWWRRFAPLIGVAAASAVALLLAWPRLGPGEYTGVKGDDAEPTLALVLVALDPAPHRLASGTALPVGARIAARVSTTRAAWLAVEEEVNGTWRRLWPDDPRGHAVQAGEQELADGEGAIVLRPSSMNTWRLRLVGSARPLDQHGSVATSDPTTVTVGP